jgi:poly-gamma-glutamate synthesis protein (capsule biosynthesis protein)
MYFPTLDAATGELRQLALVPMQIHAFRLRRPSAEDRIWLRGLLDRECRRFGRRVSRRDEEAMTLE